TGGAGGAGLPRTVHAPGAGDGPRRSDESHGERDGRHELVAGPEHPRVDRRDPGAVLRRRRFHAGRLAREPSLRGARPVPGGFLNPQRISIASTETPLIVACSRIGAVSPPLRSRAQPSTAP